MQHRTRDVLIRQRTQIINALRAHLAELGLVAAQATLTVARKLERYCSRWRRTELLGVTQLCLRARIIQFQLRFGAAPGVKSASCPSVRRIDMCKSTIALTLSLLTTSMLPPAVMAQSAPSAITEAEAQSIAVDAYVYFYSLVTMDVTRRQFTNIEPGKEPGKGPMNMFNNVPDIRLRVSRVSCGQTSTHSIPLPISI